MTIYDIAIVGAGALGTFSAWHALEQGKSVALVEAGTHANGATVRNFGQVVPSGQSLDGWRQLGIRSLEIYKQLQKKAQIPVWNRGSLYIASDEQEQCLIEEMHTIDKAMEYPSVLLNQQECLQKTPNLQPSYTKAGIFYPEELTADSPNLLPKIISYMRGSRNFYYLGGHSVNHVDHNEKSVSLYTGKGEVIQAKQLLVCCGHHLNRLFATQFQQPSMQLCKLQMLATKPMPETRISSNLLTGLTIRRYEAFKHCPSYSKITVPEKKQALVDAGIHVLFKQAPDGSLIIGDSHQYFDADSVDSMDYSIHESINQLIINEAKNILAVDDLPIARSWNGYYSQHTWDGFYRHSINENIHLLTGIGGKGMTTGPALSEKVVHTIFSGKSLDEINIQA